MKKLLVILGICALIYACSDGADKTTTDDKKDTTPPTAQTPTSTVHPGLEMITSSDCITCHKINEKNIGPAYVDVSKKYESSPAVIDTLATKIVKGGVGVWGNVPMTPHPNLSMDSAREMVRYILTLKNSQ
jgi:cytochrome c